MDVLFHAKVKAMIGYTMLASDVANVCFKMKEGFVGQSLCSVMVLEICSWLVLVVVACLHPHACLQ